MPKIAVQFPFPVKQVAESTVVVEVEPLPFSVLTDEALDHLARTMPDECDAVADKLNGVFQRELILSKVRVMSVWEPKQKHS